MQKEHTNNFHKNFISAIKQSMADNVNFKTLASIASWLDIGKVTLYKIMDEKQSPTVEQGICLCLKGGFNANWLFLNKGEMKTDEISGEPLLLLKRAVMLVEIELQKKKQPSTKGERL